LDSNYHLLSTICHNLEDYMVKVRQLLESKSLSCAVNFDGAQAAKGVIKGAGGVH
jgi:hypothetical protein